MSMVPVGPDSAGPDRGSVTRLIVITEPSPASTGWSAVCSSAGAAGRFRSATTSASSNCGPRATSAPSAATRIEPPSKISSSCPPTMLA